MSLSIKLDDLFVVTITLPSAMAENCETESICLAATHVCTWRFAAAATFQELEQLSKSYGTLIGYALNFEVLIRQIMMG